MSNVFDPREAGYYIAPQGLYERNKQRPFLGSIHCDRDTLIAGQWDEIRTGLRDEAHRWLQVLATPREVADVEVSGMIASIGHLAYHMGAIRQISKATRGPREGTFN